MLRRRDGADVGREGGRGRQRCRRGHHSDVFAVAVAVVASMQRLLRMVLLMVVLNFRFPLHAAHDAHAASVNRRG